MKNMVFISTALSSIALFSANDFSVGMHVDTGISQVISTELSYFHSHPLHEMGECVLGGVTRLYHDKTHLTEVKIGYRTPENLAFGFGFNYGHEMSNHFGFFNHSANPELRFIFDDFSISLIQHLPVNEKIQKKDFTYSFYRSTIAILSVPMGSKYEFNVIPYYVHDKDKFGAEVQAITHLFRNIDLAIIPYYDCDKNKGLVLSLDFALGSQGRQGRKIPRKFSRFFYDSKPTKKKLDGSMIFAEIRIPEKKLSGLYKKV